MPNRKTVMRDRISGELDKLALTKHQKAAVIPKLLEYARFLDTDGGGKKEGRLREESELFDCGQRMSAVVECFATEGLTLDNYLEAAVKQPSLFMQSPVTVVANIKGVVETFASKGLTSREYLQAALKEPSMFCQSPFTIAGNINR